MVLCQLARLLLLLLLLLVLLLLRQTSAACSRLQCFPPDLIRELRINVFPARPQPRAPDERSPPDLNHKESPKIYQIECQKECQNICQKVCKNRCQIECQTECQSIKYMPDKYAIYISRWYVRNYVRKVFQGGDHSKKVISNT